MSQSLSQQFLTWCRSKPADEEYDYVSHENCALAQFLKDAGYCEKPHCRGSYWIDDDGASHSIPKKLIYALISPTFGALADRLESISRSDGGES